MHVHVTCCGCARQLRLPGEVIGSKVSCPICKAVFLTRSRGDDRAEAIPVADALAVPPIDETDLLPLEPTDRGVPDFSLDDPAPPPVKNPRREPDPEPDTAPLRMIDDDPPRAPAPERRRPRRDDDDRPRKRRDEDDSDDAPPPRRRQRDEDNDAAATPRKRRREGAALASFTVFVHRDPHDKLSGRFDAEADAEGLKIWRGAGRILEVPLGAECEYLGDGRLLLPIEGRKVELTTVHPDGLHDDLAKEVCAFVEKRQDTVSLPVRPLSRVVWLALVPAGLPLVGLFLGGLTGFLVWGALAVILASLAALIVTRRNWSVGGRAWGAGIISLAGYLLLATVARLSGGAESATIPGPWCALAPIDGGFRVELPGMPAKSPSGMIVSPWNLRETYCVNVNPAGSAFLVAYADSAAAGDMEQQLAAVVRDFAQQNAGTVVRQGESTLADKKGVEFEIDARDKGRVLGRAFYHERRLFALAFVSKKLPTTCPEAAKFLDSFALDPTTGWPGPPTPAVAAAPAPQPQPQPGMVPFQPPVAAPENLGPGGKILLKHDRPFVWCGVTSDGRQAIGVAEEGTVFVFDAADGRELARAAVQPSGHAVAAALSPDDRTLVLAGSSGSVHVVNLSTREVKLLVTRDQEQHCLALSPDGKTLVTGHDRGELRFYDLHGGKAGRVLSLGGGLLRSLRWPRADLIVAGDTNRLVRLIDPDKGQAKQFKAHNGFGVVRNQAMRALGLSRDLRTLVTVDSDRTVRGWDVGTRQSKFLFRQTDPQLSVAFYPTGRLFATGSADGYVRVWDAATGTGRGIVRQRFGMPFPRLDVNGVAFTPDGKGLLTAAGPYLELWQFEQYVNLTANDRKPLPLLPLNLQRVEVGQNGFLRSAGPLATSGDGRRVAFSGKDGRLRVWETATLNSLHEAAVGAAVPVALAPSGDLLAFAPTHDTRVRDLRTGNEFSLRATNSGRQVSALALSAGGARLAVGYLGFDGHPAEMHLWDVAAKTSRPLTGHRRAVSAVAFAGDVLASVSLVDPFVRLWDTASGREFARMKGHTSGVLCLAASPDGKLLATGSQDKTARLWDVARMREALALHGHTGAVSCVAFSPDGKTLATASADKTVLLWDVGSGSELHKLTYEKEVTGVGFGPGGKALFVRTADALLDRWDLEPIEALKKRPAPAAPDLDKSPAPEVPDLQPGGPVAAPTALVVSPERKCAVVFTRDRQALRYSYPEWRLTRVALTRGVVYGAALDAAKGLLYAAVTEPRQVRPDGSSGWYGPGDIAVFDVAALLDDKDAPGVLKPAATVAVPGFGAKDLCLAEGGKSLYFLSLHQPSTWRAERLDTQSRKLSAAIEMPQTSVTRLRASPDGKSLAVLAVRKNGPPVYFVARLDPATGKLSREVDLRATAVDLELGDGGAAVVTCHGNVRFVSLTGGKSEAREGGPFGNVSPRLSPDGKRLYLAQAGGGFLVQSFDRLGDGLFDPAKPRDSVENHGGVPLLGQLFWMTPDGKFLVGATGRWLRLSGGVERPTRPAVEPALDDGRLRELPPWREGHTGRVLALAVAPDGQRVLTAGEDRYLLFRTAATGELAQRIDVEMGTMSAGIYAAAFSANGRMTATPSWNGFAYLHHWPGGVQTAPRLTGRAAGLDAVAFLPDNERVAAAGVVGLAVWATQAPRGNADAQLTTKATLTGVAAHPATGQIAAGSVEGKVYLFEVTPTGPKEKGALDGHADEVRCVAYSIDGKRLISADVDGGVRVWDAGSGKALHKLEGHTRPVLTLAVSPDNKLVAAGALDGSVRLWEIETGKLAAATPARPAAPLHALAFSPNDKTLYAAAGTIVRRWDTSNHVGPPLPQPKPAMTPVTPPAPPAPAVLPEVTRVVSHFDAVCDLKGKQVILINRLGLSAMRLSYPELRSVGSARFQRTVYKLALDEKGEKLFALRTDRPISVTASRGVIEADDAELLVYDLKEFRHGNLSRALSPKASARHRLSGTVRTMLLSPGGEALFYLDTKGKRLVKLATDALDKPAGDLKLDAQPEAMAMSPDGKSLVVGGEKSLVRIDAGTLKQGLVVPLKFQPASVAVSDMGHLAAAGAEGPQYWAAQFEPGRAVPSRGESRSGPVSVGFSADQKWVLVVPHGAGDGAAWRATDSAAKAPAWFRVEGPASKLAGGGGFVVCPDGQRLILSSGAVVKLPAEVTGAK